MGDSTPTPPPPLVQLLVNGKGSSCGACLVLLPLFLLSAEAIADLPTVVASAAAVRLRVACCHAGRGGGPSFELSPFSLKPFGMI
jgi:hypothetical protein